MKKFESRVKHGGEVEIFMPDTLETFLLDSKSGVSFAFMLLDALKAEGYEWLIKASEQKLKIMNRAAWSVIKSSSAIYAVRIAETICSCCFGEDDEVLDYDGCRFNFEYPRQCRDAKYCLFNGYARKNKNSQLCICGAKKNFGFTAREREVALYVQNGITKPAMIADAMYVTSAAVNAHLVGIYKKVSVDGMTSLSLALQCVKI